MARRTKIVVINADNRDKGKTFILTEMSAVAAEKWSTRALELIKAISKTEDVNVEGGTAALATEVVKSTEKVNTDGIEFLKALQDPSLDDWWNCVRYQHDPAHPPQLIRMGEDSQIEEMSTITKLRMEVLGLHVSFFTPGGK